MKILWVKSGGLAPLDSGGKIRSYNLLKELAQKHDITPFVFFGDHTEKEHAQLEKHFSRIVCEPLELPDPHGLNEAIDYACNLLTLRPYTMAKYCRPNVKKALRRLLESERFDVLVCDFLFTAGAIPWDWPCPKILFTHNVEEQIWRRHFQVSRNPVWKAVSWREYLSAGREERRYVQQADEVLTVSENDRDFFARYVDPAKITVIPTGVDAEYFRPGTVTEQPDTLVFTGSMDWMPNEDAVFYFVEAVLPLLQREIPNLRLFVVGRKPSQRVQALAEQEKCLHITGTVDDIREYVQQSAAYIVPLRIGGGTRIKIFEAMAMGKAIVSTTVGAEGLPVQHDENILLADEPAEFAGQIIRLLKDRSLRDRLGRSARALVETNYTWAVVAHQFDAVLERALRNSPTVAAK